MDICSSRKSIRLLVAMSCLIIFLYLGAKSSPDPQLESIRIAASVTPLNAPIWVALEKGLFNQYGINVDVVPVIGGYRSYQRLRNHEVDLATVSDSVIMFRAAEGDKFATITTFVKSDHDVKLIVNADRRIFTPDDFIGKTVGIIAGTASEYFLANYLSMQGIAHHQVVTKPLKPEEMAAALENGAVDAIAVWEPFAYQAVQRLTKRAIVMPTKGFYELTFNLITLHSTLEEKKEAITRFVSALNVAIKHINENPKDAQEILLKKLKLQSGFINWIWPDYLFKLSLDKRLPQNLSRQAKWAQERQLLNSPTLPDFSDYLFPSILMSVDPGSASL